MGILTHIAHESYHLKLTLSAFAANEKLQALFNDQILAHLQQEYVAEGIAWTPVEYRDNKECLQIIERRPDGILALLDEESTFPKVRSV